MLFQTSRVEYARRPENLLDSSGTSPHAFRCPGKADLGQSGADRRLTGDEGGPPSGAALLAVPVGEHRALLSDPVDVRCSVTHLALIVGADIEAPDVIAPDDEDVRLFSWANVGVGVPPPQQLRG